VLLVLLLNQHLHLLLLLHYSAACRITFLFRLCSSHTIFHLLQQPFWITYA
jgi:hypothetical protein